MYLQAMQWQNKYCCRLYALALYANLLAHLQQRYGNSRGYLRWAGLSETELAQLTGRLCN